MRLAGRIQLTLSIFLAIGCISVFSIYHSSLGELSRALADSILSASAVINETATTIKGRRDLIEDTGQTLLAARKLVEEIQRSGELQGSMIPTYLGNLRDAAVVAGKFGATITELGNHLSFRVPAGFHFESPLKPVIEYTTPLDAQANALQSSGASIARIAATLNATAVTMGTQSPKLQAAFIESTTKTIKLLDNAANTAATLQSDSLPRAMLALETTSRNLRFCSQHARDADHFMTGLLVLGLILACLCVCNSLVVLQVAKSMQPSDTNKQPTAQDSAMMTNG